MKPNFAREIIAARAELMKNRPVPEQGEDAAEGGCGVLGFAANIPISGRHTMTAAAQMNNRGNGKGGGIAMAGLVPEQMGVDAETLRTHTLLQIALLDPEAREGVEARFIAPHFEIAEAYEIERLGDHRAVAGLAVRPPDVYRYFVRVKPAILARFAAEKGLEGLPARAVEDEFVYQNSFKLNRAFYASLGEKRAFVLSHGRDLIVLKIVGFAEQVVEYYQLADQAAHVWIAHQRYPTKGRVWHPAGAHPFIGLNEALVHNGDFANYHAVGEYLRQRNIAPLFLTDTEVSALLFDLWDRVYDYPLEVTLEAMAPTTEHDFAMLPPERQQLYRTIQATHMHGSPDGPWFFIIARTDADDGRHELLGITDTSMLRPQVFALYENAHSNGQQPVQIGLIGSERQAINACLRSLAAEDDRFQPLADRYWVARGGSHTDGGAFRFTVDRESGLRCENKFGEPVTLRREQEQISAHHLNGHEVTPAFRGLWTERLDAAFPNGDVQKAADHFWRTLVPTLAGLKWVEWEWLLEKTVSFSLSGGEAWGFGLEILNRLRDRVYDTGPRKRASVLTLVDSALERLFDAVPLPGSGKETLVNARRLTWESRERLRPPAHAAETMVLNTRGFPAEGDESAASWLVQAQALGWRRLIAYGWRGGRFAGCGFGPDSEGTRLDLYGDVGDYAASGLYGGEVHLHTDGQDQVGQIMKRGRLVIHGDVGQTFLYGAKGGEIYVRGSAAGRPLINAVGKPRAVINGTCLDYLAESFMAGDPLQGGGFVIVNGIALDEMGRVTTLPSPYPGGNLFSLASGGAIYIRDPHQLLDETQLNGGRFARLTEADWVLIEPYLAENERLFGIAVSDLLTVAGERRAPEAVYRKVVVIKGILNEGENR